MARFILIDHSIRGLGGHHYEYAAHVLDAAAAAGFTCVLATNRELEARAVAGLPYEVRAVYRYDFWGVSRGLRTGFRRVRALRLSVEARVLRLRLALVYSTIGLLWTLRDCPGEFFRLVARPAGQRRVWPTAAAAALVFLMRTFSFAARLVRAVLRPVRHVLRLPSPRVWPRVRFRAAAVKRRCLALVGQLHESRRMRAFGADTRRLFRRIGLREGDVVFVPTISSVDLVGLGRYLRSDPTSKRASWHLLFRRNIFQGRESEYERQEPSLRTIKSAFRTFSGQLRGHRVYFYTDTERLTQQYNRLRVARFGTLPIPVNPEFARRGGLAGKPPPVRVIYAGDARSEKGYHLLPDIVRATSASLAAEKVEFVFQSNFAFRIPEQQADVVAARHLLRQHPQDRVRVVNEPLTSDEYRNLILSGHINLLLYDRDSYYARSSGILVESLSAAIPVIVPSGSWLGDQLGDVTHQYHLHLASRATIVRSVPGPELRWRDPSAPGLAPVGGDGILSFGGASPRVTALIDVPGRAGYLLVSFRFTTGTLLAHPDSYVLFLLTLPETEGRRSASRRVSVAGPHNRGGLSTVLLPLPTGPRKALLTLSNAFGLFRISITDLRLDFLDGPAGKYPLGAVGLAYSDPSEVPGLVGDMVKHYEHYRASAAAFAQTWTQRHNAGRVVAILRDASDGLASAGRAVPE